MLLLYFNHGGAPKSLQYWKGPQYRGITYGVTDKLISYLVIECVAS